MTAKARLFIYLNEIFSKSASRAAESPARDAAPAAPPEPLGALPGLLSQLEAGAAYFRSLGATEAPVEAPPQMSCAHDVDDSGIAYLRLAGGDRAAVSWGKTGGYSIRLPDEIEALASGRQMALRIVARGALGAPARFAAAYSTNDVGNSGWRWFETAADWQMHAMEWNVPPMKNGNGDFVGLLPDVEGQPGAEIAALAIFIS